MQLIEVGARAEVAMDMQVPARAASAHTTLDKILRALGVSPGAFSDPDTLTDHDAFAELVRLWNGMECAASRRALLNVARALAVAQTPSRDGARW